MDIKPDTQELKTPSGEHTILAKSYLIGEDRRASRRMLLKLADEGKSRTVEGIEEAENSLMLQVVIQIDGSSENIVERVLKMRIADYDFVMDLVNEIASGMDKKKEVTSVGNTETTSEEQK